MILVSGEGLQAACHLGVFSSKEKAMEAIAACDGPLTIKDDGEWPFIAGQFFDWYLRSCEVDMPLDCRGLLE